MCGSCFFVSLVCLLRWCQCLLFFNSAGTRLSLLSSEEDSCCKTRIPTKTRCLKAAPDLLVSANLLCLERGEQLAFSGMMLSCRSSVTLPTQICLHCLLIPLFSVRLCTFSCPKSCGACVWCTTSRIACWAEVPCLVTVAPCVSFRLFFKVKITVSTISPRCSCDRLRLAFPLQVRNC